MTVYNGIVCCLSIDTVKGKFVTGTFMMFVFVCVSSLQAEVTELWTVLEMRLYEGLNARELQVEVSR